MYDEDAKFSLTAVNSRYPALRPDETGAWKHVIYAGSPVAVVWVMQGDPPGAGIYWLRQPEPVEKLYRHFVECAAAGVTANAAYNATELIEGVNFSSEQTGLLSGVKEDMASLMEEM